MITLTSATTDKISDVLLLRSRDRGDVLTNLKLQKLLYYAQAWSLVLRDKELFREDFQAWIHGPVLPSQYHRFKRYEWRPIDGVIHGAARTGNPSVDRLLASIVDVFGVETAGALELMTHSEKPWIDARRGTPPTAPSKAVIPKAAMKEFYQSL
jgi:uncharacterized phage-associated protein